MECNAELCVYNKGYVCKLPEITINEYGMCDEFIMPDIPGNILEKSKRQTIENLMDLDEDF